MEHVGIDYQSIAQYLGYVVMTLLSFFGALLWNDVRQIKEKWITREEFNEQMTLANAERDKKHLENTGNFQRVGEKLDDLNNKHHEGMLAIEKSLGDVMVKLAEQRHKRTDGGPERRRY